MSHRIHGLTDGQYADLLTRAEGLCEVCRSAPHANIDHDRRTTFVRGLVCRPCNAQLRGVDAGTSEPTAAQAAYLAREQVGSGHRATLLRTMRIPNDLWKAAVEMTRAEGTTVTAVAIEALEEFLTRPPR